MLNQELLVDEGAVIPVRVLRTDELTADGQRHIEVYAREAGAAESDKKLPCFTEIANVGYLGAGQAVERDEFTVVGHIEPVGQVKPVGALSGRLLR